MSKTKILSNAEVAAFCRQTSQIYSGGIPISDGIDILISDTLDEKGRQLLSNIKESCRTNKMWQALEETKVFPKYVVKLIALGEESGNIDEVLSSLADFYEEEDDISDGIRSAITYPLIMIAMMFMVIIVLIVKVLPIFKQVFVQLGSEMGAFAEKLMNIGNSLSKYSIIITVIVFALIILGIVLYRVPSLKKRIRAFLAKFPLTRSFYMNRAIGRFARALHLGLSSGLDTYEVLTMAKELVEHDVMEQKIDIVTQQIQERATLAEAISKADIFTHLYNKMIDIGDQTGSNDENMKQIAIHYEEATAKQLRRILSVIEPTLVIVLSLIVGVILLSVLLPLMGIMSSIG